MSVASSNRLLFAAGIFCALLGIVVIVWCAHILPLLKIVPGAIQMPYTTAIGFVLCGFACLSVSYQGSILARLTSGVAAILGGSTLAEQLLPSRFSLSRIFYHASATGAGHIGPVNPAIHIVDAARTYQAVPHTSAICLLLSGFALFIFAGNRPGYRQPFTSAILGAIVSALALASLMEYLLGVTMATVGGRLFEMPLLAAAGFLVLGAGILHASWRVWSRRVYGPRVEGTFLPQILLRPWAPVTMTCIAATLSFMIWHALVAKQNDDLRSAVILESTKTGDALQAQIAARVTALERFSQQWNIYGTLTADQWNQECVLLVRDLPGWQELTMVDSSGHIVWSYPSSASHRLFGYDVFDDPKQRSTYLKAQKTGNVFVTPQVPLVMGGQGFVIVAPVVQRGKPCGFISGVFRSATALNKMMGTDVIRGFAVVVDEGAPTKMLWNRTLPLDVGAHSKESADPFASPRLNAWEQTAQIKVYGLHWRVRVRPTESFFAQEQSSLPAVALVLGLLLAGMVGATVHFAQAARTHAEHMGSANERLEREVSDRQIHLQQIEFERQRALQGWNEAKRQSTLLANQAQELKRSNESLTEFASIASHDLKEPLRKIQTFGDMLRRRSGDQFDGEAGSYLDRMTGAAQRMQTLIDGLLAYSRTSTHPPEMVAVDLNEVVSEVMSDLEMRVTESDAWVIRAPLPIVEADPIQMRQLFQNLLGNALKFRQPDVPARIRLTSAVHGGVARITLTDNGIGFEPRFAERIFRIFERLESTTRFEGTGIGLAICRTIVDRHHGTICASATPNEGATFTIELPGVIETPVANVAEVTHA